jgi:hypothetical protein
VNPRGAGTGLHGAREKLGTLQGEELKVLQDRLRGPLSRMDAVFAAAETGKLDQLTAAMRQASQAINAALKNPGPARAAVTRPAR